MVHEFAKGIFHDNCDFVCGGVYVVGRRTGADGVFCGNNTLTPETTFLCFNFAQTIF